MNKDRIEGVVKQAAGAIQNAAGGVEDASKK
jgi:hypothetical protein